MKDGGPAFPAYDLGANVCNQSCSGMTLRDHFAAKALPNAIQSADALVAQSPEMRAAADTDEGRAILLGRIAMMAYKMADAMLAERENNTQQDRGK